jgi:predicted GIY-YIG superfamily endonuclease
MAKRIDNSDQYEPGCIYELQVCVDGNWYPFYVGETTNLDQRLQQHKQQVKAASDASTFVYRSIRFAFEANNCDWRIMKVHDYGAEGPEAAEDEHIMMLLRQGVVLTNEKKGNAAWMAERVAQAADMVRRKITSYREYKQVITQEQLNERHQDWLAEDATETRGLPREFKQAVADRAQQRFDAEQKKAERVRAREAAVAAHRALQIAAWEKEND